MSLATSQAAFASPPSYTVTVLPEGTGIGGSATSINASGMVAGSILKSTTLLNYPCTWSASAVETSIPFLPAPYTVSGFSSHINSLGQVVGEMSKSATGSGELHSIPYMGFLYSNGKTTELKPAKSLPYSAGSAINSKSIAVGGSFLIDSVGANMPVATMWSGSTVTPLTSLDDDPASSAASINDADVIVGGCGTITVGGIPGYPLPLFNFHATKWAEPGSPVRLPELSGYPYSAATAINDNDLVVGTCYTNVGFGISLGQATKWVNGVASAVPSPTGYVLSAATSCNTAGNIVGYAEGTSGATGFVNIGGTTYNLDNCLATSGYKIVYASSINDSGDIAATAERTSNSQVTLIVVLKPATTPPAAALSEITVSPTSVVGGKASTATVTLTAAAPTGGATVALSTSSNDAPVPVSVVVPAGKTSVTFTITTKAVSATVKATVTAKYNSVSKTAVLTVT
jgi:hypothetical protein